MDCRDFETWLDAGRPAAGTGDAAEHRRTCPACAELAAADDALEAPLAARLTAPSAGFTDRVMERVAAERRAGVNVRPAVDPELLTPWWAQLLREPEAILGLTLGALYAGAWPWLLPLVQQTWPRLVDGSVTLPDLGLGAWPPLLLAGFVLPLVAAASWALYRVSRSAAARVSATSR